MMAQKSFKMLVILAGMAVLGALPIQTFAQDGPDCRPDLNPAVNSAPEYSGSYALLIGVGKYDDFWDPPLLPMVPEYLNDLKQALCKGGFDEVNVVPNPTNFELREELRKFMVEYGDRGSDDRLLIYFMGHGHSFPESDNRYTGYLVSRNDGEVNSEEGKKKFRTEAVPMSAVGVWASKLIREANTLFMLDACFSGHAIPDAKKKGKREASLLLPDPERVVRVITSGDASQKVPAKSTFTESFLEAITTEHADADKNGDGDLTGEELGRFLFWEVYRASSGKQTPYTSKLSGEGEFVFRVPRDNP